MKENNKMTPTTTNARQHPHEESTTVSDFYKFYKYVIKVSSFLEKITLHNTHTHTHILH